MVAKGNSTAEKSLHRTSSGKNEQAKFPKNIHKSEREKLKRDCQNDLFLELDKTLEPTQQNNGKASILCNAIKIIRELSVQVESLGKENAAFLREERYVTLELDELREETLDLSAEVGKMRHELRDKYNPVWQNGSGISEPPVPQSTSANIPIPQATGVTPVCIIPLAQDLQACEEKGEEPAHTHQVSKPQARYPTGLDLWPHQIFSQQQTCQGKGKGGSPTKVLSLF